MRYLTEDIVLELDGAKCRGCGLCVEVCPHGVFALRGAKALIADRGACMQCGACSRNCRFGALKTEPGVGCAAAIVIGALTGTEPNCGGGAGSGCCGESGKPGAPKGNIRCC